MCVQLSTLYIIKDLDLESDPKVKYFTFNFILLQKMNFKFKIRTDNYVYCEMVCPDMSICETRYLF